MKLFTRYNRITMMLTAMVMLVMGIIYYYVISGILTSQVDKDLDLEEQEIFSYVKQYRTLPKVYEPDHQFIYFTPETKPVKRRYIDTRYKEPDDNELEPARGLISSVTLNGKQYQIRIIQSTVETEDLIQVIFLITAGVIAILLLVLQIINRIVLNKLWRPFYTVLNQLKLFSLSKQAIVNDTDTEIDEFKELNGAVTSMSARVVEDYLQLKTFTENAAHELMTPIAIINSKLDTLLQTDQFSDKQGLLLKDLYETIARLTRLNRSMLLLTKIENKLIQDEQVINLKDIIESLVRQFEELFSGLQLIVTSTLADKEIRASKFLTEVLFNNLISNAIRHNHETGHIHISLNNNELSISNTGKPKPLDTALLFKRFQKSAESEGTGLGLTLCKQVCDTYGYKLEYTFGAGLHIFHVIF
jgi:signal transduction histidine kinase